MDTITNQQISVFSQKDGYHFSHQGNDYVFFSREKVHEFFQKQAFDTIKFCHEGKKSYVHFGMNDMEVFDSKESLRKVLSREYGGAWIENKVGKKRYFIDESGWLQRSIREVSKEEFAKRLESPSTWQKVLGIGLGVLTLAPGAIEFARHIPKETGLSLLALHQKNPLLGAVGFSCLPSSADAQAVGTEFQVNNYTTSDQENPSVAPLNDGGFVVIWQSDGQDGDSFGIFGQRYNATGAHAGSEFQVNNYTTSGQENPSVAPLNDGGFVVSWQSQLDIYGQRYNATGARVGTEFQVNTYTTSGQNYPSVAPLNDGGFVVTWESNGQDGDSGGIFGQRYDASGARAGIEFQVNTYTTRQQLGPNIASLNDGGFVVIWQSYFQDGDFWGIYGQRYNATGAQAGTEFQVNTYTTGFQNDPSVAPLNDGGFVVTWESQSDIYGQRYNATGAPAGTEFQVNTYVSNQRNPSVAPLNDGGFVITWESSFQDGDGDGIYGQRYNASGVRSGTEFQVNTYTRWDQLNPSVATLNDGGVVVIWESGLFTGPGQDGDLFGIFGQRYDGNGNRVSLTLQTPTSDSPTQVSTSTFQTLTSDSPSQMSASAFQSNLETSGSTPLSSNLNQSQPYTPSPGSMRTLPDSPAASSTSSRPTPSSNVIYSVIDIVYEAGYPIYVNGQIVGFFNISGGSGQLDSNNPNVITLYLNPNFAPEEEEEFIPLFSIPPGQAPDWQSIQLGDTVFECFEPHTEINTGTSGGTEFGLVFIGANSCTASGSQIVAGILPIMMN